MSQQKILLMEAIIFMLASSTFIFVILFVRYWWLYRKQKTIFDTPSMTQEQQEAVNDSETAFERDLKEYSQTEVKLRSSKIPEKPYFSTKEYEFIEEYYKSNPDLKP